MTLDCRSHLNSPKPLWSTLEYGRSHPFGRLKSNWPWRLHFAARDLDALGEPLPRCLDSPVKMVQVLSRRSAGFLPWGRVLFEGTLAFVLKRNQKGTPSILDLSPTLRQIHKRVRVMGGKGPRRGPLDSLLWPLRFGVVGPCSPHPPQKRNKKHGPPNLGKKRGHHRQAQHKIWVWAQNNGSVPLTLFTVNQKRSRQKKTSQILN